MTSIDAKYNKCRPIFWASCWHQCMTAESLDHKCWSLLLALMLQELKKLEKESSARYFNLLTIRPVYCVSHEIFPHFIWGWSVLVEDHWGILQDLSKKEQRMIKPNIKRTMCTCWYMFTASIMFVTHFWATSSCDNHVPVTVTVIALPDYEINACMAWWGGWHMW